MGRKGRAQDAIAISVQFGKWIREQRDRAGLTQEQLAELAETHAVHLSRIEKGRTGTTRETITALARVLRLDLREALNKAGMDQPGDVGSLSAIQQELLQYFNKLPFEQQLDLLAIADAIWRRHGQGIDDKVFNIKKK